jgi:hypothetical protein
VWPGVPLFETLAMVFFTAWIVMTILLQVNPAGRIRWFKNFDYFALIPVWTFFAPNPGTTDVHLLYRDKLRDGTVRSWREVPCRAGPLRALWNPNKRLQKGLSDIGVAVQRYAATHLDRPELVLTHPGFIILLNFVTQQPHAPLALFTQFTIARSYGRGSDAPADVMFLSTFHRL